MNRSQASNIRAASKVADTRTRAKSQDKAASKVADSRSRASSQDKAASKVADSRSRASSQDKAASKVASRNLGKADNRLSAEFRYHPDENAPGLGWSGRHWRPSATPRALQLERPAA
jgi:hypothetical protein